MKYNYYVDNLRACMIHGKWRALVQDIKDSNNWIFLDDIEYDTSSEALAKYIY